MVNYNNGRFIFVFDSGSRKFSAVYDTKYKKSYSVNHHAILSVFEIAIESLDNDSLKELRNRVQPKFRDIILKVLEKRN